MNNKYRRKPIMNESIYWDGFHLEEEAKNSSGDTTSFNTNDSLYKVDVIKPTTDTITHILDVA